MNVLTCEAGVSIKPGAPAPGSQSEIIHRPRQRATARKCFGLSPTVAGSNPNYQTFPGACAPGFTLTPASQVKSFTLTPVSQVKSFTLTPVSQVNRGKHAQAGFQ